MQEDILLSTAYFPPIEYFGLIKNAGNVLIEQKENYLKQTYRNRCRILSANGIMVLSVPVIKKSNSKTLVKDVTIDYSKRWQQIHTRALISSYNRSPYFQYYFENIERIILKNPKYLIDLNSELLEKCLDIIGLDKCIMYTSSFKKDPVHLNDFRYIIAPKKSSGFLTKPYIQVFSKNFVPGLSILDLLFNMGPVSESYL